MEAVVILSFIVIITPPPPPLLFRYGLEQSASGEWVRAQRSPGSCPVVLSMEAMAAHEKKCPHGTVICGFPGCGAVVGRADLGVHEREAMPLHLSLAVAKAKEAEKEAADLREFRRQALELGPAAGSRVVSACHDGTLQVWRVADGQREAVLVGHSREVLAVAALPGGRRVVSASADNTLKVHPSCVT